MMTTEDKRITAVEIERALLAKMGAPECGGGNALNIACVLIERLEGPRSIGINLKGVQTFEDDPGDPGPGEGEGEGG